MSRVAKTHPRIEAYGTIDELNSHLGVLLARRGRPRRVPAVARAHPERPVRRRRRHLGARSDPGASACGWSPSRPRGSRPAATRSTPALEPLHSFVLPGRHPGGGPAARLPHRLPPRRAAGDRLRPGGERRGRALPQPAAATCCSSSPGAPTAARSRCGSRAGSETSRNQHQPGRQRQRQHGDRRRADHEAVVQRGRSRSPASAARARRARRSATAASSASAGGASASRTGDPDRALGLPLAPSGPPSASIAAIPSSVQVAGDQEAAEHVARVVPPEREERVADRDREHRTGRGHPRPPARRGGQHAAERQRHRRGGVAARPRGRPDRLDAPSSAWARVCASSGLSSCVVSLAPSRMAQIATASQPRRRDERHHRPGPRPGRGTATGCTGRRRTSATDPTCGRWREVGEAGQDRLVGALDEPDVERQQPQDDQQHDPDRRPEQRLRGSSGHAPDSYWLSPRRAPEASAAERSLAGRSRGG